MNIRHLRIRGATGTTREETFQGKTYVVVPVVALVEGVIFAVNAEEPEFVPADTLSVLGWDGRPCMMDHPESNGVMISANQPEVLDAYGFGQVFNTVVKKKSLAMEGWLDPEKAKLVGTDAERVIERAQAGEIVEVSVGVFVAVEETEGEFNGKKYGAIWRDIVPDHLAFLPEGTEGACSADMGCGTRALRAARVHQITDKGMEIVSMPQPQPRAASAKNKDKDKIKPRSLRERLARIVKTLGGQITPDMSDSDLRSEVMEALTKLEPNLAWIEAVYSDRVIFCVWEDGEFPYYQRTYDMVAGSDDVTLGDRVEVEVETSYEPIIETVTEPTETTAALTGAKRALASIRTAAGARHSASDMSLIGSIHDYSVALGATCAPTTAAGRAACSCGGSSPTAASTTTTGGDMTRQERIQALMAHPHNPIKNQKALEATTDEELTSLEQIAKDKATQVAPPASAAAAVPTTAAAHAEMTEAEYLAKAPKSIRDLVERQQAADKVKKDGLLKTLKGKVNGVYTDAELDAMSVEELDRTARLVGINPTSATVDFSALGGHRDDSSNQQDSRLTPPNGYALALAKEKGQQTH
jgi:hypothetical protein